MKYLTPVAALLVLISLNLVRSVASETSDDHDDEDPVGNPEAKSGYESQGYGYEQQKPQVFYGGQYGGRCNQDGFYYNDENSFIMCNHGIAYAQQCAPGTRNGMASQYGAGGFYTHTAFCDINLVDFGYAAFHSQRGNRNSGGYKPSSGGYSAPTSYSAPAQQSYPPPQQSYSPPAQQTYHHSGQMSSARQSKTDGSSYGIYGYNGDASSKSDAYGKPPTYSQSQSVSPHTRYSGDGSASQNKGYGQSSYHSQSNGATQRAHQGYGSSRGYASYGKASTSYKQPTYQVVTYRPSYTSYQQQPSYQTSYGQQPQGHSAYGRKYTGYYTQRRYHSQQPAMKY